VDAAGVESDNVGRWDERGGVGRAELAGGIRKHRAGTDKDGCEVLLYEMPTGGHRWPVNLGDAGKTTATEIVEFFEGQRTGSE
jgi:poly(3-hydroxybutyrate) depolymerase